MKKVYTIFNADISQVILTTEDRALAEEYMMDAFMEDVLYQWYWEQQYDPQFNPSESAKTIWNDIMVWYTDYVEIFESEVIN